MRSVPPPMVTAPATLIWPWVTAPMRMSSVAPVSWVYCLASASVPAVLLTTVPPPATYTSPMPKAVSDRASSVPPSTWTPPLKLFLPPSFSAPVPCLTSLPEPLMSLRQRSAALKPPLLASMFSTTLPLRTA